jgi:hypothetical protein
VCLLVVGGWQKPITHVLVIAATVGAIGAFDLIVHKDAPFFWVKLVGALTFSVACLLLTRDREQIDTFIGVMAALLTLCAVAMTTADRLDFVWWVFFLSFAGSAILLVLFTRERRGTLLAFAAIVTFRLVLFISSSNR